MTIQSGPFKTDYVAGKDKPSARDLNARGKTLSKVARSLSIEGIASNSGVITRRRSVSRMASKQYARIIQTLRREDESSATPATEINYYEIEFLNDTVDDWEEFNNYYVDDIVKYTSGDIQLIYKCIQNHASTPELTPTNEAYWEESTHIKAWVFGYSGDLIETIPWFQPGDIVEVVKYNDSRWEDREWWILETVIRVQETSSGEVNCSIAWNTTDNRAMGVF